MKPFNNYAETTTISASTKLPVGAYICRIMKAEEKTYKTSKGDFSKLELSFDIVEGDYKDFYANDYRNQQQEDKKWKGVYRMNIPTDDGSEADGWAKRKFKTDITAIEDSNNGYHWDWNEAQLKNKVVGIIFRSEEWEFNGKNGWRTAPFKLVPVADVKSGNFKLPEPKPLQNKKTSAADNIAAKAASANLLSDFEEVVTADLPF